MCNCPIDWVACFSRDCERAAAIREMQQKAMAEVLEKTGIADFLRNPR